MSNHGRAPRPDPTTAFACFTREPVIVEEVMVDAFLARIQQVEWASRESRSAEREVPEHEKKDR